MYFIKKITNALLKKHDRKKLYLLQDIYFVIDLNNKNIIPLVYNEDYTSALRLDNLEHCIVENKTAPNDNFVYDVTFIEKKQKGSKSYTSFIYKNEEYEINHIATKMLFAKHYNNLDFIDDLKILNAEELEIRYNLARHYKTLKKHVYSHDIAYASQQEIMNIVTFVVNSKKFKKEIEEFHNVKNSANSRAF